MANQTSSGSPRLTEAQLVALSQASQRSDGRITVPPHLRGAAVQRFLQSLLAKHLIAQGPAKVGTEAGIYVISQSGLEALGLEPGELPVALIEGAALDPGGTASAGPTCDDLPPEPTPRKTPKQKCNTSQFAFALSRRTSGQTRPDDAPSVVDGVAIDLHQPLHVDEVKQTNIDAGKDAADPDVVLIGTVDNVDPNEPARDLDITLTRAPRASSKLSQVITLLGRSDGATLGEVMAETGWLAHTSRAALTGLRKRGYALERIRNGNEAQSLYRIACDVIA